MLPNDEPDLIIEEKLDHVSNETVRIGAFSAFYGDRRSAITEFRDEPVDFLIGDYLAELTMLVLRKNTLRGRAGYATGFLHTLAEELGWISDRGIKVLVNAGGLDPLGCAKAIEQVVADRGLNLRVAAITGDDLMPTLSDLRDAGESLSNMDTGEPLAIPTDQVLAANAYLGCWPLVEALRAGADIVVAPRVTDAALVIAPAAWRFDWAVDDWDRLAGALVAGHAIECGSQVTGGNFCFFDRHDDLGIPGMPIAEIRGDGSSVITKPVGTGGVVTVDTVTAQLLYEIGGPDYHNPDVIADFASVRVDQLGPNQVLVHGVVGRAPTPTTKVSLAYDGGFRSTMTLGLTGMNISAKTEWFRRQFAAHVRDPAEFDDIRFSLVGAHDESTTPSGVASYEDATAWLTISARSSDRTLVDRTHFAERIVELGVSTYPGCYFTTPPAAERQIGVQWPCLVPKSKITTSMVMGDTVTIVPWGPVDSTYAERRDTAGADAVLEPETATEESIPLPLGTLFGARSGDKAGTANLGVWAPDDASFQWLSRWLTVPRLQQLLPETAELTVERYEFPHIRGLNFLVRGFLGEGTSACLRIDTQAKGLGEYLRMKSAPIPTSLLDRGDPVGANVSTPGTGSILEAGAGSGRAR